MLIFNNFVKKGGNVVLRHIIYLFITVLMGLGRFLVNGLLYLKIKNRYPKDGFLQLNILRIIQARADVKRGFPCIIIYTIRKKDA